MRLSKRVLKAGRGIDRQRYKAVAKDTDFKETLMIFHRSKHTLINLCLGSQKTASIPSEDYLLDCQCLTTLGMLEDVSVVDRCPLHQKLLLIISTHKQMINLMYLFPSLHVCISSVTHLDIHSCFDESYSITKLRSLFAFEYVLGLMDET